MRSLPKVYKYSRLTRLSHVVGITALSVVLSATAAFAVPRDELPVPYEQLEFRRDNFGMAGYPATRTQFSVGISGPAICFPNDIGNSWHSPDGHVNANAHIIVNCGGSWIATPWDYMGIGQECKMSDHIGDVCYTGWKPRNGTDYYFYLSGISADSSGGVSQERTNIIKYTWGGPTGYPPLECTDKPVINSFRATPDPVVGGKFGLLGSDRDHNVELSWDITNGEGVILKADTGESAETREHGPKLNGVELLIEQKHTFTLTAKGCTPREEWPSKTVTVGSRDMSIGGINLLLLNNYGNAPTTD